nr:G protein-coupled receptor [Proales similis]
MSDPTGAMCRMSRIGYLPQSLFNRFSCSQCYHLLKFVFAGFQPELGINSQNGMLQTNSGHDFDPTTSSDRIEIAMNMSQIQYEKWTACCQQAWSCCSDMIRNEPIKRLDPSSNKTLNCEPIWDGWSCHRSTAAGQISKVKCQSHIVADACHTVLDYAYLQCDENGEWFRNQYGEWTDYGSCSKSIIGIKERLINVNVICQAVSLVFLIASLVIFFSYKKLRVNRIKLHQQLFISLVLQSIAQIVWECLIMKKSLHDPIYYIDSNNILCIVLNMFLQYTRSTNYFWMLCESIHLYKYLIHVFNEEKSLIMYYCIGWGIPFILSTAFAALSWTIENHSCWTRNMNLINIIKIPNILTILLNFIFLIIIVKSLYEKLKKNQTNMGQAVQFKKAVKATLILVPLFGLQLILSPIVMCDSTPGAQIANTLNRLVESLQGLIVALFFCFFNSEILNLLKQTLHKLKCVRRRNRQENRNLSFSIAPCNTERSGVQLNDFGRSRETATAGEPDDLTINEMTQLKSAS